LKVALMFLAVVAVSYAGVAYTTGYTAGYPLGYSTLAHPYAYSAGGLVGYPGAYGYSTLAHNYQLKLDTTLPGSAYTSAAPTAYGYGVVKVL
jgi:hypothetical protein